MVSRWLSIESAVSCLRASSVLATTDRPCKLTFCARTDTLMLSARACRPAERMASEAMPWSSSEAVPKAKLLAKPIARS